MSHFATLRPGLVSTTGSPDSGHRLGERLGDAAPLPLEHEQRARQRVDEVVDEGLHELRLLALLGHPPDHHAELGEERWGLGGVDERDEGVSSHRRRRTHVDVLDDERSVLVPDEVVDELTHDVPEDDRVVALHEAIAGEASS